MTRKELKRLAREQLKTNLGMLFLCTLIIAAISSVPLFFIVDFPSMSILSLIILLIIAAPLSLGTVMFYLEVASGAAPQLTTIFQGFHQFGQSFLTFLLISLISVAYGWLIDIPLALALNSNSWGLYFLYYIVLLILTIVLFLPFSWIYYVMADQPELSAVEVLMESRRIMKGHLWEYILLQLYFIPWLLIPAFIFSLAILCAYSFIAPLFNIAPIIVVSVNAFRLIFLLTILVFVFYIVYLMPYLTLADTLFYCKISGTRHLGGNPEQEAASYQNETIPVITAGNIEPAAPVAEEINGETSADSTVKITADSEVPVDSTVEKIASSKTPVDSTVEKIANSETPADSTVEKIANSETPADSTVEKITDSEPPAVEETEIPAVEESSFQEEKTSPSEATEEEEEEEEEWSWDNL